ncbi:hard-surface inducible [Fusarium napiforme]|uniref:Hard-surface inducible n=1 Tax=Fusarium napiforme TaxID=42672 RepID=A0A8H5JC60_9HYPO|nr:hard-surface inducible [Fusarium napiforme]
MFVYEGRLNWGSSARDETAAIILPSGTMRAGDPVFILSQWTRDSGGNKKAPLSQKITIDKVTKTANGDDTFTVKPGYYRWNMTSRDQYDKLDFILSTDTTTSKSKMDFQRVWKPTNSQSKEVGKIWVSKLNWPVMADNEFCLFIAPEGKLFLSMWQWSHDKYLNERVPIFRVGKQSIGTLDSKSALFTCQLDSDYLVTCAWEKTTEVLSAFMKGPEGEQEVGAFKLFANTKPHDEAQDCGEEVAELKERIKELADDLAAERAKTARLTAHLAQSQAEQM